MNGEVLIFDDTIEHEARNAGPADRVVLLFEAWRPEIELADRAAPTLILASINAYEQASPLDHFQRFSAKNA